jgi:hypothetical protein
MDVQYLDELAHRTSGGALIPQQSTLPSLPHQLGSELVDEEEDQRRISYYTAVELRAAWEAAYREYVLPALYAEKPNEEVVARLNELERLLDASMITLAGTGDDVVMRELLRLRALFGRRIDEEKRRDVLRKASRKVNKAFQRMAYRAAYPKRIQRFLRGIGVNSTALKIPTQDRERLRGIAYESVAGLSNSLAEKIGIRPEVMGAFRTLGLGFWAKREQVVERYRYLAKLHHPDRNPGGTERMTEINNAVDILLKEYFSAPTPK